MLRTVLYYTLRIIFTETETEVFSRVVISHRFRVLHSPLDGLQGGGVEHFLPSPAVTSASSAQRLPVQHMDPQQETVVHDLKAL